jgi:hypothetical protein
MRQQKGEPTHNRAEMMTISWPHLENWDQYENQEGLTAILNHDKKKLNH